MGDGYKIPIVSEKVYIDALTQYLNNLVEVGQMKKNQAKLLLQEAKLRVKTEGVHEGLPAYIQALAPRVLPDLAEQYGGKTQKWMGDVGTAYRQYYGDFLDWAKFQEDTRRYQLEQEAQGQRDIESKRRWDIEAGVRQADIMNEERRNELANRANLLARETQRLSMFQPGTNTAPYDAYRQQLADQFEQMRQLASGVTSPGNWVQTAYAQAGQGAFTNPFVQEPVDWAEESKSVKGEIQALKTAENNAKSRWEALAKRVGDDIPDNNPSEAELEAAAFRYNELKARRQGAENVLAERTMEESKGIVDWSKPRPSGATGFEVGGRAPAPGSAKSKPFTPAIPGDIQKFLEKPVWGAAVTRPSGQQWAATPWSSREKLFGYLESQGQYPIEMSEQMERELPRNPSLGRRWSPAKQFV